MAARFPGNEDRVDEVGGITIGRRRPPAWLLLVIVGVVAFGLYYLITFSVTDTGSFKSTTGIIHTVFRF
jgi:hypothetical protein